MWQLGLRRRPGCSTLLEDDDSSGSSGEARYWRLAAYAGLYHLIGVICIKPEDTIISPILVDLFQFLKCSLFFLTLFNTYFVFSLFGLFDPAGGQRFRCSLLLEVGGFESSHWSLYSTKPQYTIISRILVSYSLYVIFFLTLFITYSKIIYDGNYFIQWLSAIN